MKLISMTDFILEQNKKMKVYKPINVNEENPGYVTESTIADTFMTCLKYANFLKQPLKLEMFVACDEDGNVLEEPDSIGVGNEFYYERALDQYEQAKEKVLFEGFEVFDDNKNIEISNRRVNLFFSIRNWIGILEVDKTIRINTIEELTKLDLTLTPNAIKQLGL